MFQFYPDSSGLLNKKLDSHDPNSYNNLIFMYFSCSLSV